MYKAKRMHWALLLMPFALIVISQSPPKATQAQSGGFAVEWYSIDGGGLVATTSTNGYMLSGAIGQADAGAQVGGEFRLSGGFWGGIEARYPGYLPMVLN